MSDHRLIPLTDLQAEALRLLEDADRQNLTLRLFGGMAVHLRCPSTRKPELKRPYGDLDFVTDWASLGSIEDFFKKSGYTADRTLNTLYGDRRQLYFDEINHRQVDILIDTFEMCHQIPLSKRLKIDSLTLPLCELMLTKTQIIEMNRKDVLDVCALLLDHNLGSTDGDYINQSILHNLCGDDWGLYTTVSDNVKMIINMVTSGEITLPPGSKETVIERLNAIFQELQTCPKTTRWKMRSIMGKRIIWYEEVEEVRR
ncbi:hypothetical protein [Leptolinea tardivitalis]|nr:hypothetical protein [Leptolinea tardivitalis]GAP20170.1 hypothetical protein LTAR_00357 [Leptolinea tardivitalis]